MRHAAEKEYKRRVRAARDELSRAERAYEGALSNAQRSLRDADARYKVAVAGAEHDLADAKTGRLLGSYGGVFGQNAVRLYDNRLETPEGTVPLSRQIKAKVESSGRKTEKERYARAVPTPRHARVRQRHPCNPSDGARVRELAAQINTAAKKADALTREHDARYTAAETALASVRADRREIEQAEAQLATTKADTAAVDAARNALPRGEANTREVDARTETLLALDPGAKVRPAAPPRPPIRTPEPRFPGSGGRRSPRRV